MAYTYDQESWRPGISPWERILAIFFWYTRSPEFERKFGGIRDFVIAAINSPALANRFVYPSTINMTIFHISEPIEYSESYRHPRFIVSPFGAEQVQLRHYPGQTIKPELQLFAPLPDEAHKVKLRVHRYVRGEPKADANWTVGPSHAIEILASRLGAESSG